MAVTKEKKSGMIGKYRTHDTDTGSPDVQVALITQRIEELNRHFEVHRKDNASRHGLLKLVGQRRTLLHYLKRCDEKRYERLVQELGLRK